MLLNFAFLLLDAGFQLGLLLLCGGLRDASGQYLAMCPVFPQL